MQFVGGYSLRVIYGTGPYPGLAKGGGVVNWRGWGVTRAIGAVST